MSARRLAITAAFLATALSTACGGSSSEGDTTVTRVSRENRARAGASIPNATLHISALAFNFGAVGSLRIDDQGQLFEDARAVGQVTSNAEFQTPEVGALFRLRVDGAIEMENRPTRLRILREGSLSVLFEGDAALASVETEQNRTLFFLHSPDHTEVQALRVDGLTDENRDTALFVFAIYSTLFGLADGADAPTAEPRSGSRR